MALIDYTEAFDRAFSPISTLSRGRLALAEHDMARREREADIESHNTFLRQLEQERSTRAEKHDAAMYQRQQDAYEKQNEAILKRQQAAALAEAQAELKGVGGQVEEGDDLGSLRLKINKIKEGRGVRTYQALQKGVLDNNQRAESILSRMDETKQKAATMDILTSGAVSEVLTPDQKRRLQAYVTPGLKNPEDGTLVKPTSPMEMIAEIGQSRAGAPLNPHKRVSAFGGAFSAALEKQSGKNDPRIIELQSLYTDNARKIDAADKLFVSNPAIAELDLAETLGPPVPKDTGADADTAAFTKSLLEKKNKSAVAPPPPVTPDYTVPFGQPTAMMWSDRARGVARNLAAVPDSIMTGGVGAAQGLIGAALSPADRQRMALATPTITPVGDMWQSTEQAGNEMVPDMVPYFAQSYRPPPALTRPVELSKDDEMAIGTMVHQELGPDRVKDFLARIQAHDPAALRLAREYRDRYLAMKAQSTLSPVPTVPVPMPATMPQSEPTPGIDDAYDFAPAPTYP